jgi:hypothetical protein
VKYIPHNPLARVAAGASVARARRIEPDNAMSAAFMAALEHQAAAGGSGTTVLPVGVADNAEIARVLAAIEIARAHPPTKNSQVSCGNDRAARKGRHR